MTKPSEPRATLIAASRVALPERRRPAVANVADVHHSGQTSLAHHHTIREFVRRVSGHHRIDIDARAAWPEVRENVAAMLGTADKGYNFGLAGLAMVERIFADTSAWIARGAVAAGWLTGGQLIRYDLHAELDTSRAEVLFVVLREGWGRGQGWRYYIEPALWVGGRSFNAMWQGLWEAR